MDIAKIRKKLRDAEGKQPSEDVRTPGVGEGSSAAQPENDAGQGAALEPETDAAGPGVPDAGTSSGAEQVSQEDDRREEVETGPSGRPEAAPGVEEEPGASGAGQSRAAVEVNAQAEQGEAQAGDAKQQSKEKRADESDDGGGKENEVLEILTFGLFGEEFAFRISQLKEILKYQRITEVPRMPRYVLGITSLRGKVIPVIDLRIKILPHESSPGVGEKTKILILKGPKGVIGALVDRVSGVMRVARSEILPPPTHLSEEQLRFVEGVAVLDKRFVSIVNMEEATAIHLE